MTLHYDQTTVVAGGGDDTIVGTPTGGPDNVLYGGDGDDLILGDRSDFWLGAGTSALGALDISADATRWSTSENPDVWDASVPHTSVFR